MVCREDWFCSRWVLVSYSQ